MQNSGVLVYASETFLAELYQQTLLFDFFSQINIHPNSNIALINLLTGLLKVLFLFLLLFDLIH